VVLKRNENDYTYCFIKNATAHDNEIFGNAIGEMLSAIDNPRYVMVKKYRLFPFLSYTNSYACPSILGTNKERAETMAHVLKRQAGGFALIYTRSAEGRKHLMKCRKHAYLNRNEIFLKRKKMVR
jgi:hypothetical protein